MPKISVKFIGSGEIGIDAGALRKEFFPLCCDEAAKRLFEGDLGLIPRRGIGRKGMQFEVVGALIAHSVLQGGPSFPFQAEWVVSYILGENPSNLTISKEYITVSELTSTLSELVDKLDNAQTPEELHHVLEVHEKHNSFWEVINSSEWSSIEVITVGNKGCLIHELIFNELVRQGQDQLDSLRRGLEVLGFLSLLKKHRKVAEKVLVYSSLEVTAEQFISYITSKPIGHAENHTYQWFLDYVKSTEGLKNEDFPKGKLSTLLKFTVGLWNVPPSESKMTIIVKFLEDDDNEKLPKAGSCYNTLHLPTVHSSKNAFSNNMDIGLKHGHSWFTEF